MRALRVLGLWKRRHLSFCALWIASACAPFCLAEAPAGKPLAEHVVLIVWDGMRPDFVTAKTTPVLWKLAQSGVNFANHHSVYVTSTEVNAAALATGCYPNHSGLIGNREYRPEIILTRSFPTEGVPYMRLGDALTGGKYLLAPTIAETVQAAGFRTAVAGAKPVAALQDRSLSRTSPAARQSIVVIPNSSLPSTAFQAFQQELGPFPPAQVKPLELLTSFADQNAWTARALTEVLWRDSVPKFSVLWLGDPDLTQHQTGPGAAPALAAIARNDAELGGVLAGLEAKHVRAETAVFIVSDHGFSTATSTFDLGAEMKKAGFHFLREFRQTPRPGEVLGVSLGGSVFLYVPDHDPDLIDRLVGYLQKADFTGVIFTRGGEPGTFALKDARIDTPEAPDIVFSYRWTAAENAFGTAGTMITEGAPGRRPGFGMHASTSRFDFHNTLIAAGAGIHAGLHDVLPTANVDLAPTILHLLGIAPLQAMDGRVMGEAVADRDGESATPVTQFSQAAKDLGEGQPEWRQYLKTTQLGNYSYLDEGNEGTPPASPAPTAAVPLPPKAPR